MSVISIAALSAARDIERTDWERLAPSRHPFLNVDFFAILEDHEGAGPACGWLANHLRASGEDGSVLGIAPTYVKLNSHGDFIRDWSWATAYEQLGKDYYPKLLTAVPHTPAKGPRLLVAAGDGMTAVQQSLSEAGKEMVATNHLSSWHIALPAEHEVELLRANGFLVSHVIEVTGGFAVAEALVEVAHVEMRVERDQANPFQRQAEPKHSGTRHRIVAAD